jgi:hypothetical protein
MAKPQDEINAIWDKYRTSLERLSTAIDENDALKSDLDIDFTMPSDIAELEAKINSRLGTDA